MVLWSALVSSGNYLVSFLNFYQGEKEAWSAPSQNKKWLSQQLIGMENQDQILLQKALREKGWSFSYLLQFEKVQKLLENPEFLI